MTDVTNLVPFPGDGKLDLFAETVRTLERNLPMILKYQEFQAQLRRHRYDCAIQSGFTPEQAWEIAREG